MRLLWTKNNLCGSKLIMWGTEGDCSHFAVEFDDTVILQSNMAQGVNLTSKNEFLKHNEIVHAINFKVSDAHEEMVWKPLVRRLAGNVEYDKSAMAYWAWCVIKHRIFGAPIPLINQWGDPKKFMCIELAKELPDWVFNNLKPEQLEMTSPTALFHIIDERTRDADIRAH